MVENGRHSGVSFSDYLAYDAASAHRLQWIHERHEAYCSYRMGHDEELTPQQQAVRNFGSAVHCAILEPEEFESRYCARPEGNANSKAFKEANAALRSQGYTTLSEKHMDGALCARDCLYGESSEARLLIEAATAFEETYYATHPVHGIAVKCRPDALVEPIGMRLSLKTTANASLEGFGRQAGNLGYHRAEAFYDEVQAIVEPGVWQSVTFILIENTPPYAVAARELSPDDRALGMKQMDDLLERYARASKSGNWPAFSPKIEVQHLPAWEHTKETDW